MKRAQRKAVWVVLAVFLAGGEEETEIGDIAFSPDGSMVAMSQGEMLMVFNATDGAARGAVGGVVRSVPGLDWAPDGRTIAFTTDAFGGYDVALMTVADASVRPLTDHLARDAEPRFVLGGRAIVFVSDRDDQTDLYLLTLADGSLRRLTSDRVVERSLSVDRTGTTLAFLSTNEVGEKWLSLLRLPEAERRLDIPLDPSLTTGEEAIRRVRLSPGGEWLGFTTPVGVCLIDVERARRRLRARPDEPVVTDILIRDTTPESDFAFAPDGRRLVYVSAGQVHTRGLAFLVGGGRVSRAGSTRDRLPAFSPDGRLVALAAGGRSVEVRERSGRFVRWLVGGPEQALVSASIALERGDADQTVALLETIEPERSSSEAARRLLASAYLAAGRLDDALALSGELKDHLTVGRIRVAQGRHDEALTAFQAGTDARSKVYLESLPVLDARARGRLAEVERAELAGRPDDAQSAMRRFVGDPTARTTPLGSVYAYRRAEVLAEVARRQSGRRRRTTFRDLVRATNAALLDHPGAPVEERESALLRMKSVQLDELDDAAGAVGTLLRLLDLHEATTEAGGAHLTASAADAAAEALRLCLDHNWPKEAALLLSRLERWSFDTDATAVGLCREVSRAYDGAGRYDEGTAALERLVGRYHLEAPQVVALWSEGLPVALEGGQVPGMDLSRLPQWAQQRAWRLVGRTRPGLARELLQDGLHVLFAASHAERLTLWERFGRRWRDRAESEEYRAVRAAAAAVLGDGSWEAGQYEAALDYYRDRAHLLDRQHYARALEQYKALRRQHPDLVDQWVAAEQRTRLLYLPPEWAFAVAQRMVDPAGKMSEAERADAARRRWAEVYKDFTVELREERPAFRHGSEVPALHDNFLYRASQVVEGERAEWYLRTLLTNYPESEFAFPAFDQLARRYERRGSFLMACVLGERLLASLSDPRDEARVKARLATIAAEGLKRADLARPLYRDLADHYLDAPEWAEAQYWTALDAIREKKADEGAERLERLIARAPQAKMVENGTALSELAQALRQAGKAEEADQAFVRLITTHRDHALVTDESLLAAVWQDLGAEARRALALHVPGDLVRLLPHLPEAEQDALRRDFPEIVPQPTTRPTAP